ncbi:12849_t:CDS:2 [Cetraspora pellucida]|uniref:12849_t:CDS:1 n=1 Tax=Cetraspora pellucida TaxID=1433469 RepID=A0A9N9F439_9GLOM|nr:12849_t:CDS:2 [Cetraspora pellucida]
MNGTLDMALDEGGRVTTARMGTTFSSRNLRNAPYERQRPPKGNIDEQWSHDLFEDARFKEGRQNVRRTLNSNSNTKLTVENLFYEVTEDDLEELFSECGPVKKVILHYDRAGRSTGNAEVTFDDPKDAEAALRKYNGQTLDGQQMRIKYASVKPIQKVSSMRGSSAAEGGSILDRLGGVARSGLVLGRSVNNDTVSRGRGNKISDGRRKPTSRKPVTSDDLDADLDAYMAIDSGTSVEKNTLAISNGENGMDLS